MKKALVTGGAGFIGSHLSRRLLKDGWEVHIIDNLSTGFKNNVPGKADFTAIDLSREGFIEKLPKADFDAVFHLAAQSSGEISFDDPAYDLKTNCLSTLLLLDWAFKNKVKRFMYASSMSIYGDQDAQPASEELKASPKSFYGIGKLASESYIGIYSKMGLDTTVFRLFNVYGPGQNMENLRQGMVSIYMAYLLKNQPILVKGSPDRYRDLIYIEDVIGAFMMALGNSRSFGKIYNVGSGRKTRVKELLDAQIKAFGHDAGSYPVKFGDPTPGDTFGIYADISRINNDIGWEPRFSLEKGLGLMVKHVLSDSGKKGDLT